MVGLNFSRPRGTRLFHQIAIVILITSSISYFSMASDLGATPTSVEFRGQGTRQIWYVRYIMWFINFPLLLLELLLATGFTISDVISTLFVSVAVVVSALVGALVPSTYKWGYFTFSVVGFFYIWFILLWHTRGAAFPADGFRSAYLHASGYFSFILITYPIAWACSEGANVISPTSEMIWYGILDLLAGPAFLFFFLWKLRKVDLASFGLHSDQVIDASGERGATRDAKFADGS